tara:strand:+ start:210 stop:446 length:237 start_codon:yes stop_codon:yes gene_type:complete
MNHPKLTKTNLNKLRVEHNKVVKKEYKVSPTNQSEFDEWVIKNYSTFWYAQNWPTSETLEVEISKFETKSGNPYILEL